MKYELGFIGSPQIVAPVTVSFAGGLLDLEQRLKKHVWCSLFELHRAVKKALEPITGTSFQPEIDQEKRYKSLAIFLAEKNTGGRFSWLLPKSLDDFEFAENEDPASCPFTHMLLPYVPASWGQKVLAFAKLGIVSAEKDAQGKWSLIMWDGTRVPSGYQDENWLTQMLYDLGMLDANKKDVIEEARKLAEKMDVLLSDLLISMKIVTAGEVLTAKGAHFGIPLVDILNAQISPEALATISEDYARTHTIMPVSVNSFELVIAISDPAAFDEIDAICSKFGTETQKVELRLASKMDILTAIDKWYPKVPSNVVIPNCS